MSFFNITQLGILRPIAEMPETVPDGLIAVTGGKDSDGDWTLGDYADRLDTHFAILRLPAAEARQERPVGFNSALETWGAAEATPPASIDRQASAIHEAARLNRAECNTLTSEERANLLETAKTIIASADPKGQAGAAKVPLGPEDCPPGSVLQLPERADSRRLSVGFHSLVCVCYSQVVVVNAYGNAVPITWEALKEWQINTSIPDTGRWDATAWRVCSKPAK